MAFAGEPAKAHKGPGKRSTDLEAPAASMLLGEWFMGKRILHPIDMPRDDLASFPGIDKQTRSAIMKLVADAHAQGRWRASEDILWNPRNLEFMAYWAQKCLEPITVPMKGAGLEDHFRPFRKTRFDLAPPGFRPDCTYRISAAGDLMPTVHLSESQDRLYRDVADLVFSADCAFANLECSLDDWGSKEPGVSSAGHTPSLRVTEAEYRALTRHQGRCFDVLQLANNHILDDGEQGVAKTVEALKRDGIDFFGVYETEDASTRPNMTKLGDIKIGWVAHTFSVNQKPLPEGKPWMIDITPFQVERDPDTSRITRQIAAARSAGCDIVLLCLHWGAEWEFFPLPVQLHWAHAFAEQGADAIIGTHPHVIQPVEIYRPASDPRKAVPILYSLGNLTATMRAAYTTLSLVANLSIGRGCTAGGAGSFLTALEVTPVALVGEEEDRRRYAICVPLADLNEANLDQETRDYVERLNSYANLVLGEAWRGGQRCPDGRTGGAPIKEVARSP